MVETIFQEVVVDPVLKILEPVGEKNNELCLVLDQTIKFLW
jgi:hypothetical protein